MRCPKCGYISFDHLSACSKCSRNLNDIAEKLHGTSMETDLSLFLGAVAEAEPGEGDLAMDAFASESGIDLELDTEEEPMLDLGAEEDDSPEEGGLEVSEEELSLEIEDVPPIDLSGIEEEEDEPADKTDTLFDAAEEYSEEQGIKPPSVDLDDIDLSDLGPLDEEVEDEAALAIEEEGEAGLELSDLVPMEEIGTDEDEGEQEGLTLELEAEEEEPIAETETADEPAFELEPEEAEEPTLELAEDEGAGAEEEGLTLELEAEEETAEENTLELGEEEEIENEIELSDLVSFEDLADSDDGDEDLDSSRDPELDDEKEQ